MTGKILILFLSKLDRFLHQNIEEKNLIYFYLKNLLCRYPPSVRTIRSMPTANGTKIFSALQAAPYHLGHMVGTPANGLEQGGFGGGAAPLRDL